MDILRSSSCCLLVVTVIFKDSAFGKWSCKDQYIRPLSVLRIHEVISNIFIVTQVIFLSDKMIVWLTIILGFPDIAIWGNKTPQ